MVFSATFGDILERTLACTFMARLPTYVKQFLHTSSHMQTMALGQILSQARVIMKAVTSADEPVAAAVQLLYKDGESCCTENCLEKIICFRCDRQNHLARDCLSQ